MADILALVLQHSEDDIVRAIDEALKAEMPSKQHVINCLNRLMAPAQDCPEPLVAPQVLQLLQEPEANTGPYDQLRSSQYVH